MESWLDGVGTNAGGLKMWSSMICCLIFAASMSLSFEDSGVLVMRVLISTASDQVSFLSLEQLNS